MSTIKIAEKKKMHRFIKLNMKIPLCPPQKGDTFAQWENKKTKKKGMFSHTALWTRKVAESSRQNVFFTFLFDIRFKAKPARKQS